MQIETFKEPKDELSCICYIENFLRPEEIEDIQKHLEAINDWRGNANDYGHSAPRLQKWYHQDMKPFASTWHKQYPRWQPFQYDNYWKGIQNMIIERYKKNVVPLLPKHKSIDREPNINSLLMNYYRRGTDSIKEHRDAQPEFGENPTVLGVSIGCPRTLRFKRIVWNPEKLSSIQPDFDREYQNRDYTLQPGSLIIMAGATQKYFCHSVPKEHSILGERYSLTFRKHTQNIKLN